MRIQEKIQEGKYFGSGLYANSVLLGQHVLLFGVRCLRPRLRYLHLSSLIFR